jgi:hypothetical protein
MEHEAGRRKSQVHEARWSICSAIRFAWVTAWYDDKASPKPGELCRELAFGPTSAPSSILWRAAACRPANRWRPTHLAPVRGLHGRLVGGKKGGAEFVSPGRVDEMAVWIA